MKGRIKIIACALLAAAVVGSAGLILRRLQAAPTGRFHSYSVFPHDTCDLLVFSNGTVTLETCCGDEAWGRYGKGADGRWLWYWVHVGKKPTTNIFLVQPGAFTATFTETQTLSSFTLRRRAFKKIPL